MSSVEIPKEGSYWRHKNGGAYRVIVVANEKSDRLDEYPITVVYRRLIDNTVWSRLLSRWYGSMTPLPEISAEEILAKLKLKIKGVDDV